MELFKGENKKTMDKNKIEIQRLTANLETIRQSRFQYQNMVFQYDMDVEYFTTLLQEISTKKVLLLSIIMEMTDSWADDYNDDVKRLYSEIKKSYKETVDFFTELHKMATDKLNEAKIIQSNKNILRQNSIEDPQNDNLHQKTPMKEIALKYYYEGIAITKNNGDEIAKKFGHNSGHRLYQLYNHYADNTNRRGQERTEKRTLNKIKLIENIIFLLSKEKQQKAIDDVESLKIKLSENY